MRGQFAIGLALLVLSLFSPYLIGPSGAYLQIVCVGLALLLVLAARDGLALPGDPAAKLFLVAFIILAATFALTAGHVSDIAFALNFLLLALFGPLSRFLARFGKPGNARLAVNLAFGGAIAALALSVVQIFVLKIDRAEGWLNDPIWSAEAAVILGGLSGLGLLLPGRWRFAYLLGPVFGLATCVLTGSRGPLLMAPVLLAFGVIMAGRRWWQVLGGVLVVGAASAALLLFVLPDFAQRIVSIFTIARDMSGGNAITEVSAGTRLAFYEAGREAFSHAPWFGYGWAGKMQAVVPYLPGDGAALVAPHRHLHSDGLDFAVAGGAAGLLAYALILLAPFVGAVAAPRDGQYRLRLMGTALLVIGYAVCGLTYLMFGYEFHTTLYVCLAAILVGFCRDVPFPARRGAAPEPAKSG